MRTSEKLMIVFGEYITHAKDDKTTQNLFLMAIDEVIELESKIDKQSVVDMTKFNPSDDEDAEGFPPNYKRDNN